MLETIKSYIKEIPDISFGEFYQNYICHVQDQNIAIEMNNIKSDEIMSVTKLLEKLKRAL